VAGGNPPPPVNGRRKLSFRTIAHDVRLKFHAMPGGRITFRLLVALIGLVFVVGGLLLVPLPGPGWLVVLAGVAVWAVEFPWAQRLLRFGRGQLRRWNGWFRRQHLLVRVPLVTVLLAMVAVIAWLSMKHGLGFDPVEWIFGT
jgi:uncharacterized protein (TIGR02611 family)